MRILITGANRGLGYELAAAACARGHQVLACVRNPESSGTGSQLRLQSLVEQYPGQLTIVPLDVTSERSVSAASSYARDNNWHHIDAVINSAAILLGREQKLEELDFAQVEDSFRTNLFGPMLVMKHFLPLLSAGGEGSERPCVINISSEAGSYKGAYGGDYSYALSKSALNMFTAQLRSLLAPRNAAVYAVHPGWIRTDMGGSKAPGDAAESANGILNIVEGNVVPDSGALFIDHRGKTMPL